MESERKCREKEKRKGRKDRDEREEREREENWIQVQIVKYFHKLIPGDLSGHCHKNVSWLVHWVHIT